MAQHDDQRSPEPLRGELDTADLGSGDDVSGHAYHEQIAQALIEDNFCRNPRIGAPEDHREWFLACRQLGAPRLVAADIGARNARRKATVSLLQSIECFSR